MLGFEQLHSRLVSHLKNRVRSGELTERSLARVTGISQPHVHHVLKGKRAFSMRAADMVLTRLHLDLIDLLDPVDVAAMLSKR